MRTVGIDLAAQPERTAMASIEWADGRATVAAPELPVHDEDALAAMAGADWTGIDAPFGWPDALVDALPAFAQRGEWPAAGDLRFRATDREVHARTGIWPLSVSSDRIAVPAFRCARLLVAHGPVDRLGGTVVEVYPAAALKAWALERRGYKGDPARRALQRAVRERIVAALPEWLEMDAAACVESDHALDAVLAALVARAAALGLCWPPTGEPAQLRREGWIQVPRPGTLERLVSP